MDMWCPYGIGRESWDREVLRLVDPDPSPLEGEISLAGVFPFAGVGGSARIESLLLLLNNYYIYNNIIVVGRGYLYL